MKASKFIGMVLVLSMLIGLFTAVEVSALQEWEYRFSVQTSKAGDSGTPNGNVFVKLCYYSKEDETFGVPNTKKKGNFCQTTFKSSHAPWMIDKFVLMNWHKNGYKFLWVQLEFRRPGESDWKPASSKYYPSGKGEKDGKWIQTNDGDKPEWTLYLVRRRVLTAIGNFNELAGEKNLNPTDKTTEKKSFKYNGKISDQYYSNYDCMDMSDAPTIKYSVSGTAGDGTELNKDNMKNNGITENDRGFDVDYGKLLTFMNSRNVNMINITSTLEFASRTARTAAYESKFESQYTIRRNAFAIKEVRMSGMSYTDNYVKGNYYYNLDKTTDRKIAVDCYVKNKDDKPYNNKHISLESLNADATFICDNAYLQLGRTGKKLTAEAKSVKVSDGCFRLVFPYDEGADSENVGMTLSFDNPKLKFGNDDTTFMLWNETDKNTEFSSYQSAYKVDAVRPSVKLQPSAGENLTDWHKTLNITSTPSENTNSSGGRQTYKMQLLDKNGNAVKIKNYKGGGTGNTEQTVPSAAGSSTSVTLALGEETEGEYTLSVSGADDAGNAFESKTAGIKLDNLAPRVSMTESSGAAAGDGSKSNTYKATIEDASGTGRLYYCFTDELTAPALDEDAAQQQKSGTISSTLGKWAFIDQADVSDGKTAAAFLKVNKGENFSGRLFYKGKDAFGNETEVIAKDINIINEDSDCSIDILTDSTVAQSSHKISITTNASNKVYYRWKDQKGGFVADYKPYSAGADIGAAVQKDNDGKDVLMNGAYTLLCKVVPPSGEANARVYERPLAFDNAAPEVYTIVKNKGTYAETQNVTVRANDVTGVAENTETEIKNYAVVVNPDGSEIPGIEKTALSPVSGIINTTLTLGSNLPSGAYAVKAAAEDVYGHRSESDTLNVFYIRNSAPLVTTVPDTELTYGGLPLVSSEDYSISLKVSEEFKNPSAADGQYLYIRYGASLQSMSSWNRTDKDPDKQTNKMTVTESGFEAETEIKSPLAAPADGENTLYIQAAIGTNAEDMSKFNPNLISTTVYRFIYDDTPPSARLVMGDEHTTANISGKLYTADDNPVGMTVTCEDSSVKIEKSEDGYSVTATQNTNTVLKITDAAGNVTEVPLIINGIDREAPTAETVSVTQKPSGERVDCEASIKINEAAPDGISFAIIPEAEAASALSGGKIKDTYFEYSSDSVSAYETASSAGSFDGDNNYTYSVKIFGTTGSFRIGLRLADSLGNTRDVILGETLNTTDAEITVKSAEAFPKKADKKSIVRVNFNVPVYVLPEDKVTDTPDTENELTLEETNLSIAAGYAGAYSQDYSFAINKNGSYTLYTVDSIGRAKAVNIDINDVEFGITGKANIVRQFNGSDVPDDKMLSPEGGEVTLVITPSESALRVMPYDDQAANNQGLFLNEEQSEYDEAGGGYTKLVYSVHPLILDIGKYLNIMERAVSVYSFEAGNADKDTWSICDLIADNIDNTPPIVKVEINPEIFVFDEYEDIIGVNPTIGDVTFVVTMQDPESGIETINAGGYYDEATDTSVELNIPMHDDDGNLIDYDENPWSYDMSSGGYPVKIDFISDGDEYGVKKVIYTFTDNSRITALRCSSQTGAVSWGAVQRLEGFGTECELFDGDDYKMVKCINKTPIEEGADKDYTVSYLYEDEKGDWQEVSDINAENTYYKRVKAIVNLTDRAEERGLRITNNGGNTEKILDSYEPSFTFTMKDMYGYTASKEISAVNFDIIPGEISYQLSTTLTTNKPVGITITATDEGSGVGSVTLKAAGGKDIPLTENGTEFTGELPENGSYGITLYDKVGNKTTKNFHISNIDTEAPEIIDAVYSVDPDTITSKSVSVTLKFSKPNVKITEVEPVSGITDRSQYSVDYGTSTITFTESGSLGIKFADEGGNEVTDVVTVSNIDKTPPALSAELFPNENKTEVKIKFKKALDASGNEIDKRRSLADVNVLYGGIQYKADIAEFTFYKNGVYTFKVFDDEGICSYLTVKISEIDTVAPKITEVRWSYDYDVLENGAWVTKPHSGSHKPGDEAGFRVSTKAGDVYGANPVTGNDVTVTVITDSDTRPAGGSGDYSKTNEKTYTDNGMYIFDMKKNNQLSDSYAVDIEVIDKEPPVIDLLGKEELVFYENPGMGEPYSKDMLTKPGEAFRAYDKFGGGYDLTNAVAVTDWGGFDPDNIENNKFDRSISYVITYEVADNAHNVTRVKRTVRLVGLYDVAATVNGKLPDAAGRSEVDGDSINIALKNFSPTSTAYVRYQKGVKTMGQMKRSGTMISKNQNGEFEIDGLETGWYTFFIQTDKRDYITLQVYVLN